MTGIDERKPLAERKTKNIGRLTLLAFLLLAVWVPALFGQTAATGALTGTVTDAQGAVIGGGTVTATNADTNQARRATTNENGTYRFSLLPPGTYRVKFEASGFQTVEVPSIAVNVTETPVLDRRLDIAAPVQQEVTVQAAAEAIQTTDSTLGTVIAARTVTDLPLTTRNYINLLGLAAGANADVANAAAGAKGSQNIATNGASPNSNNYQMDGVPINSFSGIGNLAEAVGSSRGGIAIPNPDALQEFKIQTSTYDASYGRNVGANVNVVTKSGGNVFHGSAWEFLRNTALNANDWFLNSAGLPKTRMDQHQFGGTVGGPVKKDKVFFFTSYQGTRTKNGLGTAQNAATTNPSLPVMGTTGFNADASRGKCPLSATSVAQCDAAAQAFAAALAAPNQYGGKAGVFPGSATITPATGANIHPVALRLLQLAAPNPAQSRSAYLIPGAALSQSPNPNGLNGPLPVQTPYSIPTIYHEDQVTANGDYLLSNQHTLSARYFYSFSPSDQFLASQGGPLAVPGFIGRSEYTYHTGVLRLTTLMTNSLVNEARGSFQNIVDNQANQGRYTNSDVGIIPPDPQAVDRLMALNIAGLFTGTHNFNLTRNATHQYQLADQISLSRGKQTIRAGFEYGRYIWDWNFPGLNVGSMTFNSFTDFLLGGSANLASTGAGIVRRNIPGSSTDHWNARDWSSFVQDDFKVSQRLTMNLGLRWEYFTPIWEDNGRRPNVWQSLIQSAAFPVVTAPCASFPAPCPGSTLVGFVVPSNFDARTQSLTGDVPAGVTVANNNYALQFPPSKASFSPRVGFAWQPLKSGRLVLRGGAGVFRERKSGEFYVHSADQSSPMHAQIGRANPAIPLEASIADPYAGTPQANWVRRWVCPTCNGITQPLSSNISQMPLGVGSELPVPTVYQWNLNTQYEFIERWVLELGYVGSRGLHQVGAPGANAGGTTGAAPSNVASLASPERPLNCGLGACITSNSAANLPLRVPMPGFIANNPAFEGNDADYKFNSLQATVRKQFSQGLTFQGAYTFSRAFVTDWVGVNQVYPIAKLYGPNPSYHPHRFALNYSWDLPLRNRTGILGKFISGWNVSGVTIIQDGRPLTIMDTRAGTIVGGIGTRTAQFAPAKGREDVATAGSIQQRIGAYFNASAFEAPPSAAATCVIAGLPAAACINGTGFGNAGQGIILGPGQNNWDISLAKLFRVGGLREDASLQFRSEFYNAFNHPQFSVPAGLNLAQSANFGRITSTSVNPRLIQFALKYQF